MKKICINSLSSWTKQSTPRLLTVLQKLAMSIEYLQFLAGKISIFLSYFHFSPVHLEVSFRSFYGFYEDEKQFLKIEFFNPAIVKRAADLLQVS